MVSPAMNRRAKLSSVAMPYFDASRLSALLRDRAKKKALDPPYIANYTVMQIAEFKMQKRRERRGQKLCLAAFRLRVHFPLNLALPRQCVRREGDSSR